MTRVAAAICVACAVAAGGSARLEGLGPVYLRLNLQHPKSYDYVPSVLYDDGVGLWKAWWCGGNAAAPGDAIWYAVSADGISWTSPLQVFSAAGGGVWENRHTCDPSVILDPGGIFAWGGWRYAMYYNGGSKDPAFQAQCPRFGDCNNMVGVATSKDGIHWTRYSGNPILNCGAGTTYGCGQFSVIKTDDALFGKRFLVTYVRIAGGVVGLWRRESWDGVHWFNDQPWDQLPSCLDPGIPDPETPGDPPPDQVAVGCAPALDVMYDPGGKYPFLGVYTQAAQERLVGALTWGGQWVDLEVFSLMHTRGSGFYRTAQGLRPVGPIRSMYGTPNFADIASEVGLQELRGVQWTQP